MPEQPQETTILLNLNPNSARNLIHANRFSIEFDEGFVVTHFTYISPNGTESSVHSIAMSLKALTDQRHSLIEYLQRLEDDTPKSDSKHEWVNRYRPESISPADVVQCARFGIFAETIFHVANSFNLVEAGKQSKKGKEVKPLPTIATLIVRSPLRMQQEWILQSYMIFDEATRS